MVGGGKYSEKGRIVGRHVCVDPLYIEEYMKTLDSFYVIHKTNKNIAILIYFNFISIHPFSDGNGRVAKLLFYILKKKTDGNYSRITTKKEHLLLCAELARLQKKFDHMFDVNININF